MPQLLLPTSYVRVKPAKNPSSLAVIFVTVIFSIGAANATAGSRVSIMHTATSRLMVFVLFFMILKYSCVYLVYMYTYVYFNIAISICGGLCMKCQKNVLKCSLGDYLYPPSTLLLYLRLRRRRLGTALHPPLELNPTQKAPFFMGLLVSEYKYACLILLPHPATL